MTATPPVEWTWRNTRDRIQVGAFFGTLAGVAAFLVAMLYRWLAHRAGRLTLDGPALHGIYILLYALCGAIIGALWPKRRELTGRWAQWLLVAGPISMTIMSSVRGTPAHWSSQSWLQLGVMIPAFAYALGPGKYHPHGERKPHG